MGFDALEVVLPPPRRVHEVRPPRQLLQHRSVALRPHVNNVHFDRPPVVEQNGPPLDPFKRRAQPPLLALQRVLYLLAVVVHLVRKGPVAQIPYSRWQRQRLADVPAEALRSPVLLDVCCARHVVSYVHKEDEYFAMVLLAIPQEVGTILLPDITKESSGLPIEPIAILGLGAVCVFVALFHRWPQLFVVLPELRPVQEVLDGFIGVNHKVTGPRGEFHFAPVNRHVVNCGKAVFAQRTSRLWPLVKWNKLHKSTLLAVAVVNPLKLALYFDVEPELPVKSFGRTRHIASTDLLPQRDQRVEHAVLLRLAKGSESFPEGGYKRGDLQVVWFLKARYQWLLVHGVIHPANHGTLLLIEPICGRV